MPISPHVRSAYTKPSSAPYKLRYHEYVRKDPHERDASAYLLGSTFEYKQLYEERAELADMKVELGPEVRDVEPHQYDGRLLDGRLHLHGKGSARHASSVDGSPTRLAKAKHRHLHSQQSGASEDALKESMVSFQHW